MFVDRAKIYIKSGKGGDGAVTFRREPFVPEGGPDGGDGGRGGDVIFMADRNLRTLMDFKYKKKYEAEAGQNGMKKKRFGKAGENLIIKVPLGTVIIDEVSGLVMKDLTEDGESFVAAKGGRGGRGNTNFKNSVRQAPNFAEAGGAAKERNVILELKLIADVGLVGFPNVGKSSLLAVATSAQPKIANYHFTTIDPNLGVVKIYDSSFVMADIAGIIEGASEGIGLGHEFLKHVERTRLLLHVVDASGIEGRNPIEDFDKINEEITKFNPKLAEKKQIVVANKKDVVFDESIYNGFCNEMRKRGYKVFEISAAANMGVRELMLYVSGELDKIPMPVLYEEDGGEVEVIKFEEEEPFTVTRENNTFIVEGPWIKKILGSTNFDDSESLQFFQRSLRKKGVVKALEEKGVKEGDLVKIYDIEFDYMK